MKQRLQAGTFEYMYAKEEFDLSKAAAIDDVGSFSKVDLKCIKRLIASQRQHNMPQKSEDHTRYVLSIFPATNQQTVRQKNVH